MILFSFLGNGSLISEALRHYQRLERQNDGEISTRKLDKQNRRHYHHHLAFVVIRTRHLMMNLKSLANVQMSLKKYLKLNMII